MQDKCMGENHDLAIDAIMMTIDMAQSQVIQKERNAKYSAEVLES